MLSLISWDKGRMGRILFTAGDSVTSDASIVMEKVGGHIV